MPSFMVSVAHAVGLVTRPRRIPLPARSPLPAGRAAEGRSASPPPGPRVRSGRPARREYLGPQQNRLHGGVLQIRRVAVLAEDALDQNPHPAHAGVRCCQSTAALLFRLVLASAARTDWKKPTSSRMSRNASDWAPGGEECRPSSGAPTVAGWPWRCRPRVLPRPRGSAVRARRGRRRGGTPAESRWGCSAAGSRLARCLRDA